jgi:hypothetical protein
METRFTILLIEMGVAMAIQVAVLIAILVTVRRSTARMEALAGEVQKRALPTLDAAQQLIATTKPQVEEIIKTAADSAAMIKAQLGRVDETLSDVLDRTRLHVIRADELVGRTMDRVEETTDLVHSTVISPIRALSGLVQGITAGMGVFLGRRGRERARGSHDEMFI